MPKRNLIWVVVTILAAMAAAKFTRWRHLSLPPATQDDTFAALIETHRLAKQYYYDEIPPDVVAGAVRGYLRELDAFCRYIPPQANGALERIVAGRRQDIGLHYNIDKGKVTVIGPLPGSPAMKASLRCGDVILAVDGEPLESPTREALDKLLAGEKGKRILLLIQRRDAQPEPVNVVCEEYETEAIAGLYRRSDGQWEHMLDAEHRIAYVRINEFVTATASNLERVMRQLSADRVNALVLDLRDNPGGPLAEAIEVADRFIDEGLIVTTRGLNGRAEHHYAHRERTFSNIPVVVLINGNSISAPEVVAGALKRRGRAVLLGTSTFGKDVIQTPFDLGRGLGTITLTTARYSFEDPAMEPLAEQAITLSQSYGTLVRRSCIDPDVLVELEPAERNLIRLLRYEFEAMPSDSRAAPDDVEDAPLSRWLAVDRQLGRAINLLRTTGAIDAMLKPMPGHDLGAP